MSNTNQEKKTTNWEKIGIYITLLIAFFMAMNALMDIKESVAKLEVKVEKLEGEK
jgi:hypothetical protein